MRIASIRFFASFLTLAAFSSQAFANQDCLDAAAKIAGNGGPVIALQRMEARHSDWLKWVGEKVFKAALKIRYQVDQHDFDKLPARLPGQKGGNLFILGDHWGLTDPLIAYTFLYKHQISPLMAEEQADRGGIFGWLIKRQNPVTIKVSDQVTAAEAEKIEENAKRLAKALWEGKNIGLHLQGELNRGAVGDYDGKTMWKKVQKYYRELSGGEDPRVILSRMDNHPGQTVGHWGSSFGYAPTASMPDFGMTLMKRAIDTLASGVFFVPKRPIHLSYKDLTGTAFPWDGEVADQNKFIRNFMQPDPLNPPKNVYVPHRPEKIFGIKLPWGEPAGNIVLPEPEFPSAHVEGDVRTVPEPIKLQVRQYLADLTGAPIDKIDEDTELSGHLGLDSIEIPKLNIWLNDTFKRDDINMNLTTAGQMMLLANGAKARTSVHVRPPDPRLIRQMREPEGKLASIPEGTRTFLEAFEKQLKENPDRVALGDLKSGYLTYKQVGEMSELFAKRFKNFEGDVVGYIMPPSVGADLVELAILRAGKIPLPLNFTSGKDPVEAVVKANNIQHVVTAHSVLDPLAAKGMTFPGLKNSYWYLDGIKGTLPIADPEVVAADPNNPKFKKMGVVEFLGNQFKNAINPTLGEDAAAAHKEKPAVILMTSGSEGVPKQVPLTHKNQLANAVAVLKELKIDRSSRVINALPPFHSFGQILGKMAMSSGVFQFKSPDPNRGNQLAADVRANQATHIVLTPTFANLMAHAAKPGDLASLKVIVLGAEAVPAALVKQLKEKAPNAEVIEGYGITEASPVISFNRLDSNVLGSIGHLVPGVEGMVVNPEQLEAFRKGETKDLYNVPTMKKGMLLVAGDSIFDGYLNYEKEQPFVQFGGKKWYITEDHVKRDATGRLFFQGRAAREVKISGERIALDDLERALKQTYPSGGDGHQVAIQSTDAKSDQDLYLFTTVADLDRSVATQQMQQAGAPSVARIKGVVVLEKLPVLGSGKVDYKKLKVMLKDPKVLEEAAKAKQVAQGPAEGDALDAVDAALKGNKPIADDPPQPGMVRTPQGWELPPQPGMEFSDFLGWYFPEGKEPPTKATADDIKDLVEIFGRLPVENIGNSQVDLSDLEDALHRGIAPVKINENQYAPALMVRAYNQNVPGGTPVRKLDLMTTVDLTPEAVAQKLRDAGYPEDVQIGTITKIDRIPLTADGNSVNYLWATGGNLVLPPGDLWTRGGRLVPAPK